MTPNQASPDGARLPVTERKQALRSRLRPLLAAQTAAERLDASARLRHRLASAETFRHARRLMGFVPLPSEPDLLPLLLEIRASGTVVLLPQWQPGSGTYRPAPMPADGRLVPGPFGVPEPPPLPGSAPGPGADAPPAGDEPLDLILVPGLAFDRQGRRLGRGRGFYDRLLATVPAARRWGVAFDLQLVDEVPAEAHDVNVELIATPGFWLPVARASGDLS